LPFQAAAVRAKAAQNYRLSFWGRPGRLKAQKEGSCDQIQQSSPCQLPPDVALRFRLVLVEASPDGYKELGLAHIIEGRTFTAPVFAGGRVYARNTKGDVVSVDMRGK